MSKIPRQISPTGVYHWISKGINKKVLFHSSDDREFYIGLINKHRKKFDLYLHHYCIMRNHIHLLLRSDTLRQLSQFSHYMARSYATYYNIAYNWQGQVFTRSYKSFPISDDSYLLECGRYIERNPVRAKICKSPENYCYSSFLFYSMGKKSVLDLDPSPAYLALSELQEERQNLYISYVKQPRIYELNLGT